MQTFKVADGKGNRVLTVEGYQVSPHFIIHRPLTRSGLAQNMDRSAGWVVTHIISGGAVARMRQQRKATALARELERQPGVDWDMLHPHKFITAEAKAHIGQLIKLRKQEG